MRRIVRHPLVAQDIRALAAHVLAVSGDAEAALRRLDEVDALMDAIRARPDLGAALGDTLPGWRARHGGKGRALTIVYRAEEDHILVALVAFAGQDWLSAAAGRG